MRVTNSGLGCPDWPLCNGRPTPPFAGHAVIEFSNRLLACGGDRRSSLLLAYRGLAARRKRRLALAIAVGTFAQGPLGGITILVDLHPIAVASHFLLAIVVFTLATVLLVDTRFAADRDVDRPGWLRPGDAALRSALGFALIVSGAIVTTSGTHPGADDVPRLYDAARRGVLARADRGRLRRARSPSSCSSCRASSRRRAACRAWRGRSSR